jgi:hypothetical protein
MINTVAKWWLHIPGEEEMLASMGLPVEIIVGAAGGVVGLIVIVITISIIVILRLRRQQKQADDTNGECS